MAGQAGSTTEQGTQGRALRALLSLREPKWTGRAIQLLRDLEYSVVTAPEGKVTETAAYAPTHLVLYEPSLVINGAARGKVSALRAICADAFIIVLHPESRFGNGELLTAGADDCLALDSLDDAMLARSLRYAARLSLAAHREAELIRELKQTRRNPGEARSAAEIDARLQQIRNPVWGIMTCSQLLLRGLRGPLEPSQREVISSIETSAKRVLERINSVPPDANVELPDRADDDTPEAVESGSVTRTR